MCHRYHHTSDMGVKYGQKPWIVGRMVNTQYARPKSPVQTVTIVARTLEIVKRNKMRPKRKRNTEMLSSIGIIPIAFDKLYFWAPRNKKDRTRPWLLGNP